MCGIAGCAGVPARPEVLERMGAAIAHRGPDDRGTLETDGAAFSFHRLSIIDLAGGNQPIFDESRRLAIICNGEIYNHHEIRRGLEQRGHRFRTRSDVEAVVHLYEERSERCLHDMRGMFALAIWDSTRRELFLARDRLGKKPLYYWTNPSGGIVFASEIKGLLQYPGVPRVADLAAIDQFLTLQYVPSPLTAFEGIRRLPPASWLRWRDGRIEIGRYWQPEFGETLDAPEDEIRDEMMRLLREAVAIRLESEVPLGAFLSGGVDSSAVVALAAEQLSSPLRTFSIGFRDSAFDESRYARMVSERFGTLHEELVIDGSAADVIDDIIWHYDQPFGDSSAIPSFHVARITRPHVTVVLTGDGGDESFGGYDRYSLARFAWYFRLPKALRTAAFAGIAPVAGKLGRARRIAGARPADFGEAYVATLFHLAPHRKGELYQDRLRGAGDAGIPPLETIRKAGMRDPLAAMLETDLNHYLPDDLLVKMDVASMAFSLEARSPFLDHRLVEFMARVPSGMKLRGRQNKKLLKDAFRGILPDAILDRPKQGFAVPLARWLRTSLRELLVDVVLSDRAAERGYVHRTAVEAMVTAHMSGDDSGTYVLWDLLMLELWHRAFIDRLSEPRRALVGACR